MLSYKKTGAELYPWLVAHDDSFVPDIARLQRIMPTAQFSLVQYGRHHLRDIPGFYYKLDAFGCFWPDKVLILDSDTIIRGDLEKLWAMDCGIGMHKEIKCDTYNSGVVLLGKEHRNAKTFADISEYPSINPAGGFWHDQNVLNDYFRDRITEIGHEWNTFSDDLHLVKGQVNIVHFYKKLLNTKRVSDQERDAYRYFRECYEEVNRDVA